MLPKAEIRDIANENNINNEFNLIGFKAYFGFDMSRLQPSFSLHASKKSLFLR